MWRVMEKSSILFIKNWFLVFEEIQAVFSFSPLANFLIQNYCSHCPIVVNYAMQTD